MTFTSEKIETRGQNGNACPALTKLPNLFRSEFKRNNNRPGPIFTNVSTINILDFKTVKYEAA